MIECLTQGLLSSHWNIYHCTTAYFFEPPCTPAASLQWYATLSGRSCNKVVITVAYSWCTKFVIHWSRWMSLHSCTYSPVAEGAHFTYSSYSATAKLTPTATFLVLSGIGMRLTWTHSNFSLWTASGTISTQPNLSITSVIIADRPETATQ